MKKKAIFLDRDGTLNIDNGYTYKLEDLQLIDKNIPKILSNLKGRGYLLIIVTNQSGIDRGYFTEGDFWQFMDALEERISIKFDKIYFAPSHPSFSGDTIYRKPNNGMFIQAKIDFDIDLENSYMIGDSDIDVVAGNKSGCTTIFLNKEGEQNKKADYSVKSWDEIEKLIL